MSNLRIAALVLVCSVFISPAFAKTNTTTALSSSANPSTFGSSVTFTATVTPSAATGTVTFKDGSTTLGTGTLSSGKATYTTSTLTVGSHSITASYGGNTTYNASTSSTLTQTVNKANSTTTLASSANPSTYGSSVKFTATVTASTCTGTVTFKDGTTTLGTGTLSSGKATFSTSTLTAGSHSITGSYAGDSNCNSSASSALAQTVNKANTTTTLSSSSNPSAYGSPVLFTATVSSTTATGTVTFKDGSTTIGTGNVSSGTATLSISTLTVGSHSITAVYSGDTNYNTSTSSRLTQTVKQASTVAVSSSTNPVPSGTSVTFTAVVTPSAATGTVTFLDSSTTLGTGTVSAGLAALSTSTLAVGTHSITALYSGDTNYIGSTSPVLSQSVLTLSSIALAPQNVSVPVAATKQFTATGTFSDGSVGNVTASVTWTSSDTTVATISTAGVATILDEGPTTIQAAVGSVSSSTTLTGTPSRFRFTGQLINPRDSFTATVLQTGKVLIVGGTGSDATLVPACELYDPATGTFSKTGNLSVPRFAHTATLLSNGMVLIAGGEVSDGGGSFTWTASAELYDPNAGTFSLTTSLNQARKLHTATLLGNGVVLIAGGNGPTSEPAAAELYDPSTNIFSNTGSLNAPRDTHTATLLNDGTVLIAGGESSSGGTTIASAELYNPTTGTFSTTGSLNTASVNHTATLLNTGKVLIAGGSEVAFTAAIARAELYDPATKLFTKTGNLTTARAVSTATLLSDGTVLFVGGYDNNNQTLGTGELYDPTAGTFALAGNLNNARVYHAAAPLNNGLVLIAAGLDPRGNDLNTAETYQSTTTAPPPPSLQITPAVVNMIVEGTQQFTAIDNFGYPRLDVIWTVSDPSLASVTTDEDNTATLTALAPGQVTLTANAEGATAQEQVTILSQTTFPPGTAVWSAPPPAGFAVQQLAQAVPSANGPDLYSISVSADGTQSIIQALTANGQQLWQKTVPALKNNAVPDGFGGLIGISCPSGSPMTVTDYDATGNPLWQQQSALLKGYGYICYPPQIAVGGDGTTYIAEPTNAGLPSVTVVNPNGYGSSYEFPPSTVTMYGNTTNVQCCVGPPMVNTDGTMYVEYEVRTTNNNIVTSDTLYLHANSGPDVVLSSTTQNETQIPGPVIPDGNGGLLATWTASTPVIQQYPYQAVDVINGVVGTPYGLPFSPQTVTPFQSPDLVLGESGTAFASGTTNVTINGVQTPIDEIASFNVTSGAPNWTYQAAAGDKLSMIEASADGGVTVNDSVLGVIHLSASGIPNSSTVSSLPSGAVPFDLSNWVSASNGTASSFFSPDGTNGISTILAQSASPQHLGNQQGQSLPPYCRRGNVNCALAPHSDGLAGPNQYTYGIVVRQVTYWLFNLQNGTLNPLVGPGKTPPPVKIEEWEANSSDLNVDYCSWQKQGTECETPNTAAGGPDKAGQITDKMGAVSGSFTMQQQFLVDRQGVQVFWPNQNGSWYGAWGTTAPSPPNFHPNQSTNTTVGWATITQINANYAAPTSCISGCDTRPPNSGPPSQ